MSTRLATVLPPRERFAPGEAGAIGLLVARLAEQDETVIGPHPRGETFPNIRFMAAADQGIWKTRWPRHAVWPPMGVHLGPLRYAAAVAAAVARIVPSGVEIHNRPEIALALRRWFPGLPMRLVLHNDPLAMRRARTPRDREHLAAVCGIVAVSDWVRQRFITDTALARSVVDVLPNCIDRSVLPPPLPSEEREKTVLFAGRIVSDKGADAFVTACAQALPDLLGWRADMIGADRFGPHSPETPFLAALRPVAAQAGVSMLGYRSHDAVLEAMARAAIVVIPSRWNEPFGLVALEAMACGAAVIASPNGALADLVGTAGLLVNPDPADGLATAIRRLASDPSLRAGLAVRGMARAAEFDRPIARARRLALRMR